MKLIIQHDTNGEMYVYRESEAHFKKVEPSRAAEPGVRRISVQKMDDDCRLLAGEYIVVDLGAKK